MKDLDYYHTIKSPSEGIYKSKGSKFFSFAYPINSEDDVKEKIENLKKKFHDARHHCYAFAVGYKQDYTRANDDGEPSNSAGKPILGQIFSKDLTNVLVVVVRYFGGTLLGVGGLITAYKLATEDALNNADIETKTIDDKIEVSFGYNEMNFVMRVLKHPEVKIFKQDFMESCSVLFTIRKSLASQILNKLNDQKNIEAKTI